MPSVSIVYSDRVAVYLWNGRVDIGEVNWPLERRGRTRSHMTRPNRVRSRKENSGVLKREARFVFGPKNAQQWTKTPLANQFLELCASIVSLPVSINGSFQQTHRVQGQKRATHTQVLMKSRHWTLKYGPLELRRFSTNLPSPYLIASIPNSLLWVLCVSKCWINAR